MPVMQSNHIEVTVDRRNHNVRTLEIVTVGRGVVTLTNVEKPWLKVSLNMKQAASVSMGSIAKSRPNGEPANLYTVTVAFGENDDRMWCCTKPTYAERLYEALLTAMA